MRSRYLKKAKTLGGPQWFGGRQYAVLVDGGPGHVFGHYGHDGFGKWQIFVQVRYWRAARLIWSNDGWFSGWARFPWCVVEIFQSRDEHEARAKIEDFSGVNMRTPEESGCWRD